MMVSGEDAELACRLAAEYRAGNGISGMARRYHIGRAKVMHLLQAAGVVVTQEAGITAAAKRYTAGDITLRALAEETGIAETTLRRRFYEAGIAVRKETARKAQASHPKIESIGGHCRLCGILLTADGGQGHPATGESGDGVCWACRAEGRDKQ